MLPVLNVANRHKCPSSRMVPDRYIAVNAIRSIDLLDHLVDIRHSIFLNYPFVRGPHPFITETLKEGKCSVLFSFYYNNKNNKLCMRSRRNETNREARYCEV